MRNEDAISTRIIKDVESQIDSTCSMNELQKCDAPIISVLGSVDLIDSIFFRDEVVLVTLIKSSLSEDSSTVDELSTAHKSILGM